MKYIVIFFDADGVLVKSKRLFSEQLQAEFGIDAEKLQPFFKGVFRECSTGKADLKEELKKVIVDWGWNGTVEELMQFWFTRGTEIDADVAELIRELRAAGTRVYITTDNEKYRGEHLQQTLGDGKLVDGVFYSGEIGYIKKNPEFFKAVHSAIGNIPLNNALFIDDDEKNIEVAKQFGFDVFLYTNLDELKQLLAE